MYVKFWMGYKIISLKDGGGMKTFSILKMFYGMLFDNVELYFSLVLRIDNDDSLSRPKQTE